MKDWHVGVMTHGQAAPMWSPAVIRGRMVDADYRLGTISRWLRSQGRLEEEAAIERGRADLRAIHRALKTDALTSGSARGHRWRQMRENKRQVIADAVARMERAVCAVLG